MLSESATVATPTARHPLDRLGQFAHWAVLLWALGLSLHERLAQLGALTAILLALPLYTKAARELPRDVRRLSHVAIALVAWQLLSPLIARATGTSTGGPGLARYVQALELLSFVALPVLSTRDLPWRTAAWIVALGWLGSCVLAAIQHFVRWPLEHPSFLKIPAFRVRENFALTGDPRYGAGGFLFHRLRLAHGAIAILAPATVFFAHASLRLRDRRLSGFLVAALLAAIAMTFARAALGTALGIVGLAAVLFGGARLRLATAAAVAALAVLVASSSGWQHRLSAAAENIFAGERRLAMTAGVQIFLDHPVLGVGYGNHQPHALLRADALAMPHHVTLDSHNLWITTLAETGLVGAALLVAFHLLLAGALWRRLRNRDLRAAGAFLALVGFHLLSVVHFLPFHSSVALAFYFVWGAGLSSPTGATAPARRPI